MGSNLARNFNELAPPGLGLRRERGAARSAAARYPAARATADFDELLGDDGVEAVVVATPVPTHAELARRALAAGKHVFVEKPMALGADDAEALVALAEERGSTLMPGHLLLYHPGVVKLKEIVDSGELGDVLYVYGNRQNLGTIRPGRERALEPRRPRPLRHPVPAGRGAERHARPRRVLPEGGRRGRRLLPPPLPLGEGGAHAPLLARPAQDAPDDRRRHGEDGGLRRHGARPQGDGLRQRRRAVLGTYGEWSTRTGDVHSPRIANAEPLRLECEHFLGLVRGEGDRRGRGPSGVAVVRALEQLQASLERERV